MEEHAGLTFMLGMSAGIGLMMVYVAVATYCTRKEATWGPGLR